MENQKQSEVTVHYQLLTRHEPENENEIRRYSCSECTDDVFNINVHAQLAHNTLMFDVDPEETAPVLESGAPFHPCGILGCTFAPHELGPHSWQARGRNG